MFKSLISQISVISGVNEKKSNTEIENPIWKLNICTSTLENKDNIVVVTCVSRSAKWAWFLFLDRRADSRFDTILWFEPNISAYLSLLC